MSIQVGDRIPEATFKIMTAEGIQDVTTRELFAGKKVVVFAVPAAFSTTCSEVHLPGFIEHLDDIKAKGVDTVACIAVNDPWVMAEWGKASNVPDGLVMLSDGNGEFTEALGLSFDGSAVGMGIRSRRYAAVVDDGVVEMIGVEPGREVGVSSAQALLEAL